MSIPHFLIALALPPLASAGWQGIIWLLRWTSMIGMRYFITCWITASASGVGLGAAQHHWAWAGGSAVSLAISVLSWWWRKNRRRVRAVLGAKSRALRDALAAKMPRPRPIFMPGGVS